jgi:hypothetical protein
MKLGELRPWANRSISRISSLGEMELQGEYRVRKKICISSFNLCKNDAYRLPFLGRQRGIYMTNV